MTKYDVLNYLREHYQEFHKKYNVEKIGIFGSYAKDEATQDSDIDVFVQMHPKLLDMIAINQLIEDIILALESGYLLDDITHPNKEKYPNQNIIQMLIHQFASNKIQMNI